MSEPQISGHGGHHIVSAAQAYGATTLFTLSGAHIFPLYDAAVGGNIAIIGQLTVRIPKSVKET